MNDSIEEIHNFWFGELDSRGLSSTDRNSLWFSKNEETDDALKRRFGDLVELAVAGGLDDWRTSDQGLVALVILLDQFSRNIYRDTPQAFAADPKALALATEAIDSGRHSQLPAIHRVFLYLPLEHSEDLALQEKCVELFQALAAAGDEALEGFARYASAHHEVIARFGRFPHRNEILGRASTPEELEYLLSHGGF